MNKLSKWQLILGVKRTNGVQINSGWGPEWEVQDTHEIEHRWNEYRVPDISNEMSCALQDNDEHRDPLPADAQNNEGYEEDSK